MERADTYEAVIAGLRAAGWQLRPSRYRGGVLASTEICHGGSSADKLSLWPRPDGGLQAKCWTAGCEGKEFYDAIRRAAGIEVRQEAQNGTFRRFSGPARPGCPETGNSSAPSQDTRLYARRLWNAAAPIPTSAEHPARRWLAARSLWRPEFPAPSLLRWLPGAPRWAPWAAGCLAAPVAAVEDWTRAWPETPGPLALARVAVDEDGGRPSGVADKRTLGQIGTAAGILVGNPPGGGPLLVCEGLADALALAAHGLELLADCPPLADAAPPVLALIGTSAMRSAATSGLASALAAASSAVVVAADADADDKPTPPPGVRAALILARAVEGRGGRAYVSFVIAGKDAADAARSAGFPPLAPGFAEYGQTLRDMHPETPRWETARQADVDTRGGRDE